MNSFTHAHTVLQPLLTSCCLWNPIMNMQIVLLLQVNSSIACTENNLAFQFKKFLHESS